jgi:molybdopterin-guanine dinucleotide biosynthesis protein A
MVRSEERAESGWLSSQVAGVILAGGRNSRMGGADKAFLRVEGRTVFQRTLELLQRCFPHVVVVSNQPQKYQPFDVQIAIDEFPGGGPLAGIHAALGVLRLPYAFVVACDMPFLRIEPIRFLVERIGARDAVIARWDGDIEPLHAVYSRTLRDHMEASLRAGRAAIRQFLPEVAVDYVSEREMRAVPGVEEAFRNINTPEEAARFAVQGAPEVLVTGLLVDDTRGAQ